MSPHLTNDTLRALVVDPNLTLLTSSVLTSNPSPRPSTRETAFNSLRVICSFLSCALQTPLISFSPCAPAPLSGPPVPPHPSSAASVWIAPYPVWSNLASPSWLSSRYSPTGALCCLRVQWAYPPRNNLTIHHVWTGCRRALREQLSAVKLLSPRKTLGNTG